MDLSEHMQLSHGAIGPLWLNLLVNVTLGQDKTQWPVMWQLSRSKLAKCVHRQRFKSFSAWQVQSYPIHDMQTWHHVMHMINWLSFYSNDKSLENTYFSVTEGQWPTLHFQASLQPIIHNALALHAHPWSFYSMSRYMYEIDQNLGAAVETLERFKTWKASHANVSKRQWTDWENSYRTKRINQNLVEQSKQLAQNLQDAANWYATDRSKCFAQRLNIIARLIGLECFVDSTPDRTTIMLSGALLVVDVDVPSDVNLSIRLHVTHAQPDNCSTGFSIENEKLDRLLTVAMEGNDWGLVTMHLQSLAQWEHWTIKEPNQSAFGSVRVLLDALSQLFEAELAQCPKEAKDAVLLFGHGDLSLHEWIAGPSLTFWQSPSPFNACSCWRAHISLIENVFVGPLTSTSASGATKASLESPLLMQEFFCPVPSVDALQLLLDPPIVLDLVTAKRLAQKLGRTWPCTFTETCKPTLSDALEMEIYGGVAMNQVKWQCENVGIERVGAGDVPAVVISRIVFRHLAQLRPILMLLRQQITFNLLYQSCLPLEVPDKNKKAESLEISLELELDPVEHRLVFKTKSNMKWVILSDANGRVQVYCNGDIHLQACKILRRSLRLTSLWHFLST